MQVQSGAMWWVNTCQAWRDDGELVARVRAGDVAGLISRLCCSSAAGSEGCVAL